MTESGGRFSRKMVVLRALGWGFGGGVGLGIVLGIALYFYTGPHGRNKRAFIARNVTVGAVSTLNEPKKSTDPDFIPANPRTDYVITFFMNVDLENRTGEDVTLPDDMRVMSSEKDTGALSDYAVTPPIHAFLPAHHMTSVLLISSTFCPSLREHTSKEMDECYAKTLRRVDLVLFDPSGKYEIKIPTPDALTRAHL
jgi:hypothetical protein